VVLEELGHARKRGARIYAEFLGSGASGDAYNIVAPHPEGLGAVSSMKSALRDARLNVTDVDYINAHGTSTPLGDEAEALAIRMLFGSHADRLPVSATKSMIGHLLGASAGVETVATVMTLDRGVIHPTVNFENPDPSAAISTVCPTNPVKPTSAWPSPTPSASADTTPRSPSASSPAAVASRPGFVIPSRHLKTVISPILARGRCRGACTCPFFSHVEETNLL